MSAMRTLVAMVALALTGVAGAGRVVPAATAADWRAEGPSVLVLTYRAAPAARSGLRQAMRATLLPRLARLQARAELARYRVLANRYVDNAAWDMLVMLEFRSPAALARWRGVEDATPAGLAPGQLTLVAAVETAPGTMMRVDTRPRAAGDPAPVYLVVPYDYLVSTDDYLRYVDGYLVPQLDGWMAAGALGGYQLFLPRYAAGRNWSSLLLLAYRGDAGLDARDRVVQQVRARLAATSPPWKAFADNKQNIRTEKQPIVADELIP